MSGYVHPGGVAAAGGVDTFVSAWQEEDPAIVTDQWPEAGAPGRPVCECGWLCVDWLIRTHAATWLEAAARGEVRALQALPPIADEDLLRAARDVLTAACRHLDVDVARITGAGRDRWDAARAAAWDGPWRAAWECANAVVLGVPDCPRESAIRLAKEAARDSAFIIAPSDELRITQEGLYQSALRLLASMAEPYDARPLVSARSRRVVLAA